MRNTSTIVTLAWLPRRLPRLRSAVSGFLARQTRARMTEKTLGLTIGLALLATLLCAPAWAANTIYTAGTGITITTTAGATSRVIANSGVTSLAGTANQVNVSGSTGAVTLSLIGPYTPTTYTAHGIILGEGTSSMVATAVMTNGQLLVGSTGADPAPATVGCTGCSWTTGAGTLSLTVTGTGGFYTVTQVPQASCPYTVLSTDVLLLVGSTTLTANCVVNFPAATGTTRVILVKKQDTGAFSVAATPHTTDTFDGVNAAVNISIQYEELGFVDFASGKWAEL